MITIISGTNRPNSNSRIISNLYAELLQKRNIPCHIIDLADLPVDFIGTALYDNSGANPNFNEVAAVIEHSEKFVFIVPEYNGSFPGVLKAFIDGLAYPFSFRHKKASLVGISSGGQGGILAISHLTDIFNYLGMHVMARKVRLPYIEKNMSETQLTNPSYLKLLEEQIDLFLPF
jgi:chromate reductase, NAD(P)H dehydrogenase (quinone)